jgi:hypothetical protein
MVSPEPGSSVAELARAVTLRLGKPG